jgi:hypothetical protein
VHKNTIYCGCTARPVDETIRRAFLDSLTCAPQWSLNKPVVRGLGVLSAFQRQDVIEYLALLF